MRRNSGLASFCCLVLLIHCAVSKVSAQSLGPWPHPRPVISQTVDENKRVILNGNTRPEATPENDHGRVPDDHRMEHMLLQLKRSPEIETALEQFIEGLQTPGSPNYHQWISAQEFGAQFGVAPQDLDKVTDWLERHHLQVNVVYPSGMVIDFSGTARDVRHTFGIDIHWYDVDGHHHFANTNDPDIPAAIAPIVAGIVSLHDFPPHTMHQMRTASAGYTFSGSSGETYALVPADLATIYNLKPLFAAGYTGQGQTIVLIEDTDVFTAADWSTFRSTLGLSSYSSASFKSLHPAPPTGTNNCNAPGIVAQNDAEAILDAEWASAAAPSAAIEMAACADTGATFGGLIAMQNLLNGQTPPAIMSISYGQCETVNGAAANAAYNSAYQLAVSEGVSVFVAAGDSGAAGCDNSATAATHGIGVNAFASTSYNVAVGGTDFSDTLNGTNSIYWGSSNTSNFGSALSYIPEIPWNNSCAGALLSNYEGLGAPYGPNSLCNESFTGALLQTTVAGGGGPSGCATGSPSTASVVSGSCKGWPKPSWQAIVGNPSDGVRDTPDVSLFAADGLWSHYYVFCWSDTANGGAACTGAPSGWSGAGGTSFSSPIMAGIQALVNQRTGARQGNPNPIYYQLAASEYASGGNSACNSNNGNTISPACIFNDVTLGDMDVNCTGRHNCYLDGAAAGVLSTSNNAYQPAYGTNVGWDFATGIGTLNAANLVNNWPGTSSTPNFALSASPASVTIAQGSNGTSTVTVYPEGGFSGSVSLSATGLPSGVSASFNPASTAGTSTLTLTATGAAALGTSTVTITGTSGGLTSTTTLSLTVNVAPKPNFALSASPSTLSLVQGTMGASTVTVAPQNGFSGSISLSASGLPSGVTASFNPASTASSSVLTLTASGTATTGSSTVTITGISGSLTNATTLSLTVTVPPPGPLPSPWVDGDIGATGQTGSAGYTNGTFTVNGAGAQIYGIADSFNFVHQSLTGDGSIVARLVSFQGASQPSASVGVMIRNTLDPSAANAKTADWPYYKGIYFDLRQAAGNSTSEPASVTATLPYWVKVVRSGNAYFSYASPDGVNWTQVGTVQTVVMGQSVNIGLAVSSGNTAALATATFDNVTVNNTQQPVPAPWVDADLGAVGVAGNANYSNGTFTVNGAGARIYGTADSFNFVYQPLAGDGTIVARLVSWQGTAQPYASVGVMIRDTLDPAAANAKTADWPDYNGIYFDVRAVAGNTTSEAPGVNATLPYWIKVSRSGSVFSSYISPDGVNWTPVGTAQTVTMGQNVFIGLAVSSGITTSLASATFDNVSVTTPPPPAPNFTLMASPASVTITQGTSGTTTITVTPQNGFGGNVTLSASGLPSGVTASFNPTSTTGSSILTLSASSTAATGPATVIITGMSGTLSATVNVPLTVNAAPLQSFTLIASPSKLTLVQGAMSTSTVTVMPQNGFSGSVSLSASGLPTGVTASFSPPSTTGSSTLTLTASGTATTGLANVTITGMSGSLTSTANVSLTVTAALIPNFTLSASPNTLNILQGSTGTSTLTVTPQNGFSGSVSFSASGLPSGVTASFTATSTTSSTLTLTASGTAATGTSTVTITGTTGSLTNTTTLSLTVTALPPGSLPSPWVDGDIGTTGLAGSASYNNATFTVNGAGARIYGTADAFNFVYQPLTGDGSIVARLVSFQGVSGPYTAVGVMIRDTLDPAAANAKTADWPSSGGLYFDVRPAAGGSTTEAVTVGVPVTLPYWIKVVRSGNAYFSYASPDGVNWTQVGTVQTVVMGQSVNIGLAVSSGNTAALATATFDNVTVNNTQQPVPAPWVDADLGAVGVAGNANYSNGTFTVNGAGARIYGTADSFNFVYQPLAGDGTIVARLVSWQGTAQPYASVGVMIRDTLDPAAANAKTADWPDYNGIYFDVRAVAGNTTSEAPGVNATLPYWIKVSRSGSVFSSYISPDGVNWTPVGTAQTVTMGQNVFIGLAVSSGNPAALASVTFDNVSVTNPWKEEFTP
jgi:subtilase family serine protease/acyl-CoA thioesterase FadM